MESMPAIDKEMLKAALASLQGDEGAGLVLSDDMVTRIGLRLQQLQGGAKEAAAKVLSGSENAGEGQDGSHLDAGATARTAENGTRTLEESQGKIEVGDDLQKQQARDSISLPSGGAATAVFGAAGLPGPQSGPEGGAGSSPLESIPVNAPSSEASLLGRHEEGSLVDAGGVGADLRLQGGITQYHADSSVLPSSSTAAPGVGKEVADVADVPTLMPDAQGPLVGTVAPSEQQVAEKDSSGPASGLHLLQLQAVNGEEVLPGDGLKGILTVAAEEDPASRRPDQAGQEAETASPAANGSHPSQGLRQEDLSAALAPGGGGPVSNNVPSAVAGQAGSEGADRKVSEDQQENIGGQQTSQPGGHAPPAAELGGSGKGGQRAAAGEGAGTEEVAGMHAGGGEEQVGWQKEAGAAQGDAAAAAVSAEVKVAGPAAADPLPAAATAAPPAAGAAEAEEDGDGQEAEAAAPAVEGGFPAAREGAGGLGGSASGQREHLFEKAVTPSDVGKLNRLVIPKQHAERCFPLDPNLPTPAMTLAFEDESGKQWRFRYSYWSSSQSYVLTKGWSRFVKEKLLVPGDVVFFDRGAEGELYIGYRRRPAQGFVALARGGEEGAEGRVEAAFGGFAEGVGAEGAGGEGGLWPQQDGDPPPAAFAAASSALSGKLPAALLAQLGPAGVAQLASLLSTVASGGTVSPQMLLQQIQQIQKSKQEQAQARSRGAAEPEPSFSQPGGPSFSVAGGGGRGGNHAGAAASTGPAYSREQYSGGGAAGAGAPGADVDCMSTGGREGEGHRGAAAGGSAGAGEVVPGVAKGSMQEQLVNAAVSKGLAAGLSREQIVSSIASLLSQHQVLKQQNQQQPSGSAGVPGPSQGEGLHAGGGEYPRHQQQQGLGMMGMEGAGGEQGLGGGAEVMPLGGHGGMDGGGLSGRKRGLEGEGGDGGGKRWAGMEGALGSGLLHHDAGPLGDGQLGQGDMGAGAMGGQDRGGFLDPAPVGMRTGTEHSRHQGGFNNRPGMLEGPHGGPQAGPMVQSQGSVAAAGGHQAGAGMQGGGGGNHQMLGGMSGSQARGGGGMFGALGGAAAPTTSFDGGQTASQGGPTVSGDTTGGGGADEGQRVKCFVEGSPFGVSVDLSRFSSTQELREALLSVTEGSSVVYQDKEGDMILLGDESWEFFLKSVRRMYIRR